MTWKGGALHDEIKNLNVLSISWIFNIFFSALTSHAGKILAAISPPASKYCTELFLQKGAFRKEGTERKVRMKCTKRGYRMDCTERSVQKGRNRKGSTEKRVQDKVYRKEGTGWSEQKGGVQNGDLSII